MRISTLRAMAHGAIALVLAACGGGGDGGIGGTGTTPQDVSVGTITAFGSVWVNGVEFSSDGATVKRDDNQITHGVNNPLDRQGGLRKGMIARVDGSISGKNALTITVKSAAKGRVEATPTPTQMLVMGQTIVIDSSTNFENGVTPALGDYVEVHGLVVGSGQISAGFVETKAVLDVPPFAVKGIVSNHTAGTPTFSIGGLVVNAAGAVTSDMPATSWNGLMVEVKGTACNGSPICGTLTASKVEPEDLKGDISKVELEGIVSTLNPDGFNIGAQKVITNGGTTYVGGLLADLLVGTKVEVEGPMVGGILTATKVSFRENIRFEANIATLGVNSLTLVGLPGITIETNALTQFKNRPFGQLAVGYNMRIRGRPGSGNNVISTEIEFRSTTPDNRVSLQAAASAVAAPNVTLLNVIVDTTSFSDNSFKAEVNGVSSSIGRTAFFQQAAVGRLIKARGNLSGSTLVFNLGDGEIELEQ